MFFDVFRATVYGKVRKLWDVPWRNLKANSKSSFLAYYWKQLGKRVEIGKEGVVYCTATPPPLQTHTCTSHPIKVAWYS
jgi:hypothetical protein